VIRWRSPLLGAHLIVSNWVSLCLENLLIIETPNEQASSPAGRCRCSGSTACVQLWPRVCALILEQDPFRLSTPAGLTENAGQAKPRLTGS